MTNSTTVQILDQQMKQLSLFNAQGQVVKTMANLNSNQVEIQRQNLESGIYFYKIFTKEGLSATGKIIIQ